jgi:hypothetical protein
MISAPLEIFQETDRDHLIFQRLAQHFQHVHAKLMDITNKQVPVIEYGTPSIYDTTYFWLHHLWGHH